MSLPDPRPRLSAQGRASLPDPRPRLSAQGRASLPDPRPRLSAQGRAKHVLVVGGGFAGLAAATSLSAAGARVTLLERRPRLGGRAYSVTDEHSGDTIDNGQHLFMSCYRSTLQFLERIGTRAQLDLQPRLDVAFIDGATGKTSRLQASSLPPPFDLLGGVAGFSSLSWRDKLSLVKVAAAIHYPSRLIAPAADYETVDGWLDRLGQSPAARRAFFHPLTLATLNDDPRTASAKLLETVLREGFFGSTSGSSSAADGRLAAAKVPLSQLYVEPARAWLEAHGATVRPGVAVERVLVEDGVARGVRLRGGEALTADAVIAAVPPRALLALVDPALRQDVPWWSGLERLQSSPIVSVHLWLDRLVTDEAMIGVVGSPLHWIFQRNRLVSVRDPGKSHLSLVVSAARALVDAPSDEIVRRLVGELQRLVPAAASARVLHSRVIKEREATIAHQAGAEGYRPRTQSPIAGLFAAGDYVRTGLPATIESAVRSGDAAAALALDFVPPKAAAPSPPSESGAFVPLGRLSSLARPTQPSSEPGSRSRDKPAS
jgi:squalene-associated FAD-dependent desaturase